MWTFKYEELWQNNFNNFEKPIIMKFYNDWQKFIKGLSLKIG